MSQGCLLCGGEGRHVLFPLELVACADCFLLWIREESLSVEAVEAVVGCFEVSNRPYAEHIKRFDTELLKRTEAWVAERRTARAAA